MKSRSYVHSVVVLTAVFAESASAATFMGLGDLPGGLSDSFATAISSDGRVVVGVSESDSGRRLFRWTAEAGTEELDLLSEESSFTAVSSVAAVSADGSAMAGSGRTPSGAEGFRWAAETGLTGLGRVPGASYNGFPQAISADGEVVVGAYVKGCDDGDCERAPFRWTTEKGMVRLGPREILDEGYANDVSADGTVVVGGADFEERLFGNEETIGAIAYHWTVESGFLPLRDARIHCWCPTTAGASDVSDDGLVVVGQRQVKPGYRVEAFRWTADAGTVGLGARFEPTDVSGDGSVIVGWTLAIGQAEPVMWDAVNGVRSLRDVFVDEFGLDLTGWTLLPRPGARDIHISANGRVIVGNGTNPSGNREAWMAIVPEPSSLLLLGFGTGCSVAVMNRHNNRGRRRHASSQRIRP